MVEVRVDPANVYWTSGVDVAPLQVIVGYGTGRTAGGDGTWRHVFHLTL